jgi:hypothetical protein
MHYYILGYKANGAEADRDWLKNNVTRFACKHYDHYEKFYDEIVVQYIDSNCSYGSVSIPDVHYFRCDFFDIISHDIKSLDNLQFGKIISNKNSKILDRWITYWMPSRFIRGKDEIRYWKCKTCGAILYNSALQGRYLVEAEVKEDPLIIASGHSCIREDLYKKLQSHPNWKKLKQKILFEKIDVLKNPLDGFPPTLSRHKPPICDPEEVYRECWEKAQKVRQERQIKRKRQIPELPPELAKKRDEAKQWLEKQFEKFDGNCKRTKVDDFIENNDNSK